MGNIIRHFSKAASPLKAKKARIKPENCCLKGRKMNTREKKVARERIPRELTEKVEKGIRENAKRGYP